MILIHKMVGAPRQFQCSNQPARSTVCAFAYDDQGSKELSRCRQWYTSCFPLLCMRFPIYHMRVLSCFRIEDVCPYGWTTWTTSSRVNWHSCTSATLYHFHVSSRFSSSTIPCLAGCILGPYVRLSGEARVAVTTREEGPNEGHDVGCVRCSVLSIELEHI